MNASSNPISSVPNPEESDDTSSISPQNDPIYSAGSTAPTQSTTSVNKPPPPRKRPGFFARIFGCCGSGGKPAREQSIRESESELPTQPLTSPLRQYLLPPLTQEFQHKKCLVLDLDETLVHSSFTPMPNPNFVIPVEIEGKTHQVYVAKRPGVDFFLEVVGELFEVVVFTASLDKYANPVLDRLDFNGVTQHRLFREDCVLHRDNFVKDLSMLGRDLDHVIIVDNSPTSYCFHPENAIGISSWFSDPHDTDLSDLLPFLEDLANVNSVRAVLTGS
eukprot:TRINITY_DN41862_c0_g1_i1.p1 TRINITY_DN41862_c0_g1~~TRINITY_DN41862_c0_g1_i1.p1  ORF type:complete len:276 (-),score=37.59 TRINITY_DN41862_c0_g1_i1:123-950(-)